MSHINNLPNSPWNDAGQSVDELRQHNPSLTERIVRRGQEAMERKRRSFEDWLLIAEAIQVGRTEVMQRVGTNKPIGKRYENMMGEWLKSHSFHLIDKSARNRLCECLQHRVEIERWRATLTEAERFRYNHPDTVLRRWKRATIIPDPNAPRPPSAFAKLKEANVNLQERLHRAEREIAAGGGDLWASEDTPDIIANVMLAHLSASKAERVARAILRKLGEKKTTSSKLPAKQVSGAIGGAQ
jgi:hypothetical protein